LRYEGKGVTMLSMSGESGRDYVEFLEAGVRAEGEYHCSECGYGITIHARLPICPMCGGESWERIDRLASSRAVGLRA